VDFFLSTNTIIIDIDADLPGIRDDAAGVSCEMTGRVFSLVVVEQKEVDRALSYVDRQKFATNLWNLRKTR